MTPKPKSLDKTLEEIRKTHRQGRPRKDYTGRRFGRLVVYGYVGQTTSHSRWLCQCDCGNTHVVGGPNLVSKKRGVRSCGCLLKENGMIFRKPDGVAAANALLASYKYGARKRDFSWNLTDEQFFELTKRPCFYCGKPPSNVKAGYRSDYVYSGVDRLDNSLGYTLENCQPCCEICNKSKRGMSLEDFSLWITSICMYRDYGVSVYGKQG